MKKKPKWFYVVFCRGCLADAFYGKKDMDQEPFRAHAACCVPQYDSEDEAYWAGVARAMEMDANEVQEFEGSCVFTYEMK